MTRTLRVFRLRLLTNPHFGGSRTLQGALYCIISQAKACGYRFFNGLRLFREKFLNFLNLLSRKEKSTKRLHRDPEAVLLAKRQRSPDLIGGHLHSGNTLNRLNTLLVRPRRSTLYALVTCLLSLLILIGCVRKVDYFEGAPSPPPARLAHLPHPPGQCGPACVKISRAIQLKHPLDRVKRLKEIARNPDLSLHEQLYLIKATLDLEIFGIAEVFKPLATHPYLRYTARKHLLTYTNRLTIQDAESITKLLLQNQGVPDELTEMEKLWSGCFNIDYYALLDLYRQGAHSDEIMTTYYLSRVGAKQPEVIRRWRKRGDSWYVIILKRLRLDPSIIFIPLPPQKDIPEPFYRAYHAYWLGLSEKTPLNDITINRLIQLKVVVTYYDLNPIEVMKEIAGGKTFDEIIREQTKKPTQPRSPSK